MLAQPKITAQNSAFAQDVARGLSSTPKFLSSKYFYDAAGDRLFQQIMDLPEYYLTRTEGSILRQHGPALGELLAATGPFDLIELGAGDGLKTRQLLQVFQERQLHYRYLPVDISSHILGHLEAELRQAWPELPVIPLAGDYFRALEQRPPSPHPKVVLFLGSTIGNLTAPEALAFLQQLRTLLQPGDRLLIGFDLKKDPHQILAAYDDAAGVTRAFNLNLLHRINRELGGNFDPPTFVHWPTYNPLTGETKSYLVSTLAQTVELSALRLQISFQAWEAIDMELSKKYDLGEIDRLAQQTGFCVDRHFQDEQGWFTDALFSVG